MKASLIDRSNYYKGLLVLIGRDRIIDLREREFMLQFGKMLDFDNRFCEAAIANLLDNKYLTDEPILFDERTIAECFLRDGLRLALIDKELHSRELSWLKTIARANKIADKRLETELRRIRNSNCAAAPFGSFEILQYL